MAYQEPQDAHGIVRINTPYLEFPRLMYPREGGFPKKVKNSTEQAQAAKEGFLLLPPANYTCGDDGRFFEPDLRSPEQKMRDLVNLAELQKAADEATEKAKRTK